LEHDPSLRITFDPPQNARNIVERGLPFELVAALDWDSAVEWEDTRKDHGEQRTVLAAPLNGRLHIAVVTAPLSAIHGISFRKANKKKARRYGEVGG
jgi:uncharacterized DUF497 family protein